MEVFLSEFYFFRYACRILQIFPVKSPESSSFSVKLSETSYFPANKVCDGGAASEDTTAFVEDNMSETETISSVQIFTEISTCLDDADSCIDSLPSELSDEIRKTVCIRSNTSAVECKEPKLHELFKLFTDYGSRVRRVNGTQMFGASNEEQLIKTVEPKLSTNAIIRLAGEKFIQFLERSDGDMLMAGHLFSCQFSGLNSWIVARDAKLIFYLLAAAEKVGQKQFDHARKLLDCCDELSSSEGDPVQRLVFYFSKALNERIDQQTRNSKSLNFWKKQLFDVEEEMMSIDSTFLAVYKAVPAGLIIQLAGIQAIVEHVTEAREIHIIDLSIKGGQHHSMLIQALAMETDCHLKHLKITAIGTTSQSKIEETGKRLRSFARSLNLPFSFNVIMVEDILNLDQELLSVDPDETVVVYSSFFLRTMLAKADRLDYLFTVIKNTKPYLMVVAEVEANLNSPVFGTRFIEALFFYGAQFDSLEDCMKNDESNRSKLESSYFSKGIDNVVAAEGEQRTFSKVKVEVWRAFFHRFGMVETSLGITSLYHANLVLKDFPFTTACTFQRDGECLILGWKETPLYSLSAWKFI